MKWRKASELPKEDCEVPVKVFSHRLQKELFRIGIFQMGKWTIREKYGPEDIVKWLDESQSGEGYAVDELEWVRKNYDIVDGDYYHVLDEDGDNPLSAKEIHQFYLQSNKHKAI